MRSKLLYILFLLPLISFGQQDPMYTQYIFDKAIINPGFIGSVPAVRANVGYRQQFMGFEGAPTTGKLTLSTPLQKKSMGIGLVAASDKLAASGSTTMQLQYSYGLRISKVKLSFGLQAGATQHTFDFTTLKRTHATDDAITYTTEQKIVPDASAGFVLSAGSFYFSYSANHLIGSKLSVSPDDKTQMAKLSLHNIVYTGMKFDVSEQLVVEPAVLIKNVAGAPMQVDINANFIYNQSISAGLTYRTGSQIGVLLRYLIADRIMIGYSYDYMLNGLSKYSTGSHEILLGYNHPLLAPIVPKKIDTRSYF